MPYVEVTTKAGNTIEIERYYTSRYQKKGQGRAEKSKPTGEEQKKINTRLAEKKLRRLMNANFDGNDYHVILPYIHKAGEPYRSKEEMRDDIDKFLRSLRKAYKAEGRELKYIHVMEIGTRGARHHHLVISHIDPSVISKAWKHSRPQIFPLDPSGQYAKLAAYFIKYTDKTMNTPEELQGKRWNCSRNLVHPKGKVKIISSRGWYREEPSVPGKYKKDYYIDKDSVRVGVHSPEYFGYGFMSFTLVKRQC